MEERENSPELEILTKIHNQLVDLKQIIVEIELAKPGASATLKDRLGQLLGDDQRLNATGHSGTAATERKERVIAPENTNIEPGEASEK